jgi:uncharacterized protein YciI
MNGGPTDVVATVEELCATAERVTAHGPLHERVTEIVERFRGPLRVAIAGRVKAGKSTLLNALVGERLAATDAGECTHLVTLYRHAAGYEVSATLRDGRTVPLVFRRDEGALAIDLAEHEQAHDIEHLDVGWPSRALADVTLIDTPGLESLNDENSQRTRAFLEHDGSNPANADAVVYLMRHLHRADADFLGSFMDRSVAGASPVNAVAVLSRSDEIGACRPDAMVSAKRIADRYAADPDVRSLVSSVVAIAGLLAETGLTLRESEYAQLAELAAMPDAERVRLLLSVDDFCDVQLSPLTAELRRDLLERLGMFGVRTALDAIASGSVTSARELSTHLVDVSGVAELQRLIAERFLPRARLLKARTALVALRAVAAELTAAGHDEAPAFAAAVDRADASALEFALLQAAHLVMSGSVKLPGDGAAEVERALSDPDLAAAFDLVGLDPDERQGVVLAGVARWREAASDPIAGPLVTTVADTMARVYERLYAGG